jgi:hypothetical protein
MSIVKCYKERLYPSQDPVCIQRKNVSIHWTFGPGVYGDVIITGEGLQNLGLCSVLKAFEQGGIFIVPHLLWHGASDFPVSSEGPPHSVASYDTQVDVETLF